MGTVKTANSGYLISPLLPCRKILITDFESSTPHVSISNLDRYCSDKFKFSPKTYRLLASFLCNQCIFFYRHELFCNFTRGTNRQTCSSFVIRLADYFQLRSQSSVSSHGLELHSINFIESLLSQEGKIFEGSVWITKRVRSNDT